MSDIDLKNAVYASVPVGGIHGLKKPEMIFAPHRSMTLTVINDAGRVDLSYSSNVATVDEFLEEAKKAKVHNP